MRSNSRKMLLNILLFIITISMGCAHTKETNFIAKVGEESIAETSLSAYMSRNPMATREEALNSAIRDSILFQEAKRLGYDKHEDVRRKVDSYARQLTTSYFITKEIAQVPVIVEEEAKKLYDANWRNIKYPRWLGTLDVVVHYQKDNDKDQAMEIARELQKKFNDKGFDKTDEAALSNFGSDLALPANISVRTHLTPKMFFLEYRQQFSIAEKTVSNLKVGEMSDPMTMSTSRNSIFLLGITSEYPREEIAFDKVKSELMLQVPDFIYNEKINEYIGSVKDAYPIQYRK